MGDVKKEDLDKALEGVGEEDLSSDKEKLSAKDMVKAIKNMKVDDNGKNVISASIETFSMAEGKNKKGDIYKDTLEEALATMKALVAAAIEVAEAKKKKKKKKNEDPAHKWKFEKSPLKQFDKNLDDVYTAFLLWGLKDPEEKDASESTGKVFNVSKSFRRLESYAEWMDSTGNDLTEPELTPESVKEVHKEWKLKCSYDKEDRFVWWVDMAEMDIKKVKSLVPEDSLRYFVWYCHFLMFDERAQKNGVIFVENLDRCGFIQAMTLVPPKLSAKLDRLTIGVLPVKMKKFYMSENPRWMNIIMAIMSPFMSKKMKSRMVNVNDNYDIIIDAVGGKEYCFKDFGHLEGGLLKEDPVEIKYFS